MRSQKWVYDQTCGVRLAKGFHYNKPPTILDMPARMAYPAVNIPDPQTPVGAKGIAEAAVGAGAAAVRCVASLESGTKKDRRPATTV